MCLLIKTPGVALMLSHSHSLLTYLHPWLVHQSLHQSLSTSNPLMPTSLAGPDQSQPNFSVRGAGAYWILSPSFTVSCPTASFDLQGSALSPSSTSQMSRLIRWRWPGVPLPRPLTPFSWATQRRIWGIALKSPSTDPKPEPRSKASFPQESTSSPWSLSVVMPLRQWRAQLLQVDILRIPIRRCLL